MTANLTRKIYSYVWEKDSMRQAEISFNTTAPGKFRFDKCVFVGVNKVYYYDLDDWSFLGDLAQEITRLVREDL